MKINISALDNELRTRVGEVATQLGFEMDVNGYAIEAKSFPLALTDRSLLSFTTRLTDFSVDFCS